MERGFARGFDENQHHSRDWDESSGNPPGQAAPSILGRLKKVLSSVRGGSGRDRKGRGHSQASSASGYVVHAADAGELAIEPDRKIYERVLSQLDRSQPIHLRLEVLDGLSEFVRDYKFSDLPAMWDAVRDLAEPGQSRQCIEKAIGFMGTLSSGANFDRLGPLRFEFFSIVQRAHADGDSLGLDLQLTAILHITRNAQSCAPFELETCSIVVSWLNSVSEGRHQKVETHQDLLNFASAFVKFCSVSLPEETFTDLVNAVCRVYRCGARQAASTAEGEGGGGGGGAAEGGGAAGSGRRESDEVGWNLRHGCLAFFDVVARYTVPPVNCLAILTEVLCMAVNESMLSREAWAVMRNILVGEQSLPMLNHLMAMLHGEAVCVQDMGAARQTTEIFALNPHRQQTQVDLARRGSAHLDGDSSLFLDPTSLLRGAIFFVSNATWGSSRIEGMPHSRHMVLRALLPALNRREPEVCEEVLLSMKRLLGKFGPSLRFEWDIVFQILEKCAEALTHIKFRAARVVGGAAASEEVVVAQGGAKRTGDLESHMALLLDMVGQLRKTRCFHGLDMDFYRLVAVASVHAPRELSVEALEHLFNTVHPAQSGWLQMAGDAMEHFYEARNNKEVRLRALEGVWELVRNYQAMYEEELVDALVLPNLSELASEADEAIALSALQGITDLAHNLQSDRFPRLVEIIMSVAHQGVTPGMRHAAVRSMLSLLEATFPRIPSSRFLLVYHSLLPLVSSKDTPADTRSVVIEALSCIQASSDARPLLSLETGNLPAPSLLVLASIDDDDDTKEEMMVEGAAGREVLDVTPMFEAFVEILESSSSSIQVFAAASHAIVRGLQNRVIYQGQNVSRLAEFVISSRESGCWAGESEQQGAGTPGGGGAGGGFITPLASVVAAPQPHTPWSAGPGAGAGAGASAGSVSAIGSSTAVGIGTGEGHVAREPRGHKVAFSTPAPRQQLLHPAYHWNTVAYAILELIAGGWGWQLHPDVLRKMTMCFVECIRHTQQAVVARKKRPHRAGANANSKQSSSFELDAVDKSGKKGLVVNASLEHDLLANVQHSPGGQDLNHGFGSGGSVAHGGRSSKTPYKVEDGPASQGGKSPGASSAVLGNNNLAVSPKSLSPPEIGGERSSDNRSSMWSASRKGMKEGMGGSLKNVVAKVHDEYSVHPAAAATARQPLEPSLIDSTRVCVNAVTIGSLMYHNLIHLHLPVILDLMVALEHDMDCITLVTSCIQYTKFIAVQGDTYTIPAELNAKYIKVLSAFSDQRRWGGLIANLAMRSIALMYLQTSMTYRTRLARDMIPMLQERSKRDSETVDAISETMLDWILRHATSDLSSEGMSIHDASDDLFDNPGTKTKIYAVGNSVITIRSSVLGLVSIVCRRPTDFSRLIYMSPRTRVQSGAKHAVNSLVSLLLSRLKVPDVSAVGKHSNGPKEVLGGQLGGDSVKDAHKILSSPFDQEASIDQDTIAPQDAQQQGGGKASDDEAAAHDHDVDQNRRSSQIQGGGDPPQGAAVVDAAIGDATGRGADGSGGGGSGGGGGGGGGGGDDATQGEAEVMSVAEGKSVVEALDPDVVLLQWRRGPFAEGDSDKDKGPVTEELVESAALQRALRLLDMTPLTFTHKFGIIYIGHSQQHESDFLRNTCGSAVYEEFLNSLGTHTPLAMCSDDVFTGGLDRMSCKDGEFALLWRSSLAQCAFFVGTLMPNEPGEQINKKRFIGNTYVKIVYTDSDAPFTLAHLSGQFNLVVVVIRPIPNRLFRVSVLRDPTVKMIGPVEDTTVVPMKSLSLLVRRIVIDSDVAAMIAAGGEGNYSSNWQERLKQIRNVFKRHMTQGSSGR